nr:ATP-binding protein [Maliibacterium massiliense]
MFHSLRMRMITIYLGILLIAVVVLGSTFMAINNNEYLESRTAALQKEAALIADTVQGTLLESMMDLRISDKLKYVAEHNNATIWIVDTQGLMVRVGPVQQDERDSFTQEEVAKYLDSVLRGNDLVLSSSTFGGRFTDPMLSVATAIRRDDRIVGAVFMHTKVSELKKTVGTIGRQLWISGIIAAVSGIFLILLMADHMTRPLREMSGAAKKIAQGDFSQRVKVSSRDELGELAASFNRMSADLEGLEQMRRDFVANVSHELRTPMTSVQGFIQGMRDGVIPPEEQPQYMDLVLQETKRLSNLIRELLDLSQIESGQFPLHKSSFDLSELICRILIKRQGMMEQRGIEVHTKLPENPVVLYADPERLEQVFANLLDNAIKFSPEQGVIDITLARDRHGRVTATLEDHGCGIDPKDLPYIFDRFYKVDKAHTPGRGSGLGLSIVKKIIDQHDAEIYVHSALGKGTKFTLVFHGKPLESSKTNA